jgi:long-chain acyl-CoA synthetase
LSTLHSLSDLIDGLERAPGGDEVVGHRQGGAEVWSRGELGAQARALATGLGRAGVADGEVIGLLAGNRPQWVLAFLAITRAGAVAMPLSEHITAAELERIVEHSGCRRIFTTRAFVGTLARLARPAGSAPLALILLDEPDEEDAAPPADAGPVQSWRELATDGPGDLPAIAPEQGAVLVYTSGTTGTPKGVPLSHANIAANIRALLQERLAGPELSNAAPTTVEVAPTFVCRPSRLMEASPISPNVSRKISLN